MTATRTDRATPQERAAATREYRALTARLSILKRERDRFDIDNSAEIDSLTRRLYTLDSTYNLRRVA